MVDSSQNETWSATGRLFLQFETDYDANDSLAWNETEIENPRGFFEDIYRLAAEEWKEDLRKASGEDQSTW